MAASFKVIEGGQTGDQRWLDSKRGIDPLAEDAVLSNVLIDSRMIDEVRPFLKDEHFFSESRRQIYAAMCEIRDTGSTLDLVTVSTWLRDHGRLAQVGGASNITAILNAAPAVGPAQVCAYARSVRDKWVRRQLDMRANEVASKCRNDDASIEQIVNAARASIDELAESLIDSEKSTHVKPVLSRAIEQIEAAHRSDGKGARPTGFDRLDRITAGLHSELILIGARPGMGKTSLATAIALNRALAGEGAYIASLETSDSELMTRMACSHGKVQLHRCRSGQMTPTDWSKMTSVAQVFANLSLWVDDQSAMTVAELWSKVRRVGMHLARAGKKLGIVVVDYIQLLRAPRSNMVKREEVIAENARMLKAMAQELDCPVLALAQLNRGSEQRTDKRPQLADLRESGELEQCARTVLLLYREDYYRKHGGDAPMTHEAEVHVAKQNNGPTGMIRLHFDEECVRFCNIEDGSDEDGDRYR